MDLNSALCDKATLSLKAMERLACSFKSMYFLGSSIPRLERELTIIGMSVQIMIEAIKSKHGMICFAETTQVLNKISTVVFHIEESVDSFTHHKDVNGDWVKGNAEAANCCSNDDENSICNGLNTTSKELLVIIGNSIEIFRSFKDDINAAFRELEVNEDQHLGSSQPICIAAAAIEGITRTFRLDSKQQEHLAVNGAGCSIRAL